MMAWLHEPHPPLRPLQLPLLTLSIVHPLFLRPPQALLNNTHLWNLGSLFQAILSCTKGRLRFRAEITKINLYLVTKKFG